MKANREWLSISDMMAGLMMVFLFIAVVFMQQINKDKTALIEIASTYKDSISLLNQALHEEFDDDLARWGAEILNDNTIMFKEPDVLFEKNEHAVRERFKKILDEFFPRYVEILSSDEFIDDIIELRVEGHTSTVGPPGYTEQESYLYNANLSQQRAFSVLDYVFTLAESRIHQKWLIQVLRANGLAFAKLIYDRGVENKARSRRVEFRVITNTEERIERILKRSQE